VASGRRSTTRIFAAFLGLEHATDRAAATRAVLEGVSFALRDCKGAIAATGTEITSLLAISGGSRSEYWLRALATVLDMPIDVPAAGEFGAAMGAARLGMMAATGDGADIATRPAIGQTVEPDPRHANAFEAGYARYVRTRTELADLK
jgi:xylulokinase